MTTDTQAKLLEQLLMEADKAPAPSQGEEVVHRPDAALPLAMVATDTVSAGYVYIYDTHTFERSVTNRNMLLSHLKKVRPDGSKVFTTVKPPMDPTRGTITCLLHADRPERARYAALGWAACPKSNLPSHFQLMQHMRHRHRVEWSTIEEERVRLEKEEDRAFQRGVIALATRPASGASAPVPVASQRERTPRQIREAARAAE